MKKWSHFILMLFLFHSCFGQESIKNWKRYYFPKDSLALKFNFRDTTWDRFWAIFSDKSGEIIARDTLFFKAVTDTLPFLSPWDEIRPSCARAWSPKIVKKVSNGYLLAQDRSLNFISEKGDSYYGISRGYIIRIFEYDGKIYVARREFEQNIDVGEIWEMELENNKWIIRSTIKLPSAPSFIFSYNKKMVIVMMNAIQFFDEKSQLRSIGEYGYMFRLPLTAVIKNDDLYVGMRGGVYKINLKSEAEEWYRAQ